MTIQKNYTVFSEETFADKMDKINKITFNTVGLIAYNMMAFEVNKRMVSEIVESYFLTKQITEDQFKEVKTSLEDN